MDVQDEMHNGDVHVYPLNDLREHFTSGPGCPCAPRVEVVGGNLLYVHNAFDFREIFEGDLMQDILSE